MGEFSEYLSDFHVQVPKLKLKKDWAKGLDPNFVDNYATVSMFDHHHKFHDITRGGDKGNEGLEGDTKGHKRATVDELFIESARQQITYPEQRTSPRRRLAEDGEGDDERRGERLAMREDPEGLEMGNDAQGDPVVDSNEENMLTPDFGEDGLLDMPLQDDYVQHEEMK